MRRTLFSVGAALLASLLTVAIGAAAGFLINPSFEMGDLSGWAVTSGNVPDVIDTAAPLYVGIDAFDGDYFADMEAGTTISQSANVPQSCGAAAVRFAVYEAPQDATLRAGWSACGLTTTPVSVSDGLTWLAQEHWRIGCSDTDDTFRVEFETGSDPMSLDGVEVVCVPGASPGGSGIVSVNVAWPEREYINPITDANGQGPEPWIAYYRVIWLFAYAIPFAIVRALSDKSQFFLLYTGLFLAATWAINSIEAAFAVWFLYVVLYLFMRTADFFKSFFAA